MAQKRSKARIAGAVIEYYSPEPVKNVTTQPDAPLTALEQMFGYYGTR